MAPCTMEIIPKVVSNDFGSITTQPTQLVVDGTPTTHTVASISMDMIFSPPPRNDNVCAHYHFLALIVTAERWVVVYISNSISCFS